MAYYSFQSHFLVVKVQENNDIKGFSCTLFCPFGQNELDIKKCDAQILYILGNLRSPNKVRGSNRPKAVTEYTLFIVAVYILSVIVTRHGVAETLCTAHT